MREGWRELVVARAQRSGDILHLRLVDPAGATLPSFTPGSHVVLDAGGQTNAYSMTGGFLDPAAYELCVLRVQEGRGGSRWLHEQLNPGDHLSCSGPRSSFPPVANARHHLLIAGGIGVTPMLSHVRAALMFGRSFELVYGHRPDRQLGLRWLERVCGPSRLRTATDRITLSALLRDRLAEQPLGTIAYVCGPPTLMDWVTQTAADLGWPSERVHTEAFATAALEPGDPFEVRLRRSGRLIRVDSGVSLLEALESHGVEVPNLCRQGVCGECRVSVTAGRPLHRDLYLSEEEQTAGDTVMCCVSRAAGPLLELAL